MEVARISGVIGTRDSKDPGGGHLTFSPPEFAAFLAAVKQGRHER